MSKVIIISCEADKVEAILDALEDASYGEGRSDLLGAFDVKVEDKDE